MNKHLINVCNGDSMYSNLDILRAIKSGDLVIRPFSKKLVKSNAIVFRLDNVFAVPKEADIDPVSGEDVSDAYEIVEIGEDEKFELAPGDFVLARTYEKVAISPRIAMFIEGRSTLARLGISVTQTAMVIESGHGFPDKYHANPRKIVLEISNTGPFNIYLTPKMRIAKGVILELDTPTDMPYDSVGRYGKKKNLDDLLPVLDKGAGL